MPPLDGESGQSENTSDNQENQSLDWAQALQHQKQAFQQQGKTVESLQRQLGENNQVLGRVKQAFTGESEKEVDPYDAAIAENEQFMDYFLQQGLEAERAGKPMPLTVTLGTKLAQANIAAANDRKRMEGQIAQLQQQMRRQQNPNFQGLERASQIMEGMIDDSLTQMYGEDAGSSKIKSAQFNAVTARVNEEIKDLMQNDPDTLIKIQRNPKLMRNMVNHFMSEMLPPKVRSMLEEQHVQNTPMSTQELYSAFTEARKHMEEAERNDDPRAVHEYSKLMDSIRQDILADQYGGRRNAANPSLNRLLTGTR